MMNYPAVSRRMLVGVSICVAGLLGCYGPNPNYLGVTGLADDSESGVAGGGSSTSMSDETSTDTQASADTELSRETETETETGGAPDETSDSGDSDPSCANGHAEADEFCFAYRVLVSLPEIQAVAVADFNGDALVDLAVGRKDDVLVLFGDGSGGFPIQANIPEPKSNYFGVVGGDLDGDELADLVLAVESADVIAVYRSLGGGAFAEPLTYPSGDQPQRSMLIDLDGDAVLDLVVAIKAKDAIDVLLGDGSAGFAQVSSHASGGAHPNTLALGHFNADAALDLVVANVGGKSLALLLGDGLGGFAPAQVHPLLGKPRSTVVADFNRDTHLDVALALEDRDTVQLLYGDGLGGLIDEGHELPVGERPMGAVASDFDRDGAVDLLVINHDDASVGLLFGQTTQPGEFLPQQHLVWFTGFANMSTIALADLNHDGVDDVLIGGSAGLRAMISTP